MADNHNDDPLSWSRLGRFFHWLNRMGETNRLTWALGVVCVLVILLNLTYSNKGHYGAENILGFYAFYGFVAFSFIIFAATALRGLIKRPEDYYGKKAIDRENYPKEGTERIDHDVD